MQQSKYEQNKAKERKLQPSQLLPITSCNVVGQVREVVIVIVITAQFSSLFLKK